MVANAPVDGVHVNARATDADTISLQVCNDTASPIAVNGDFPYRRHRAVVHSIVTGSPRKRGICVGR